MLEGVPLVGHGLEQLGLGVRGAGVAQPVVQEGGGPLVHVPVRDGPQETDLRLPSKVSVCKHEKCDLTRAGVAATK